MDLIPQNPCDRWTTDPGSDEPSQDWAWTAVWSWWWPSRWLRAWSAPQGPAVDTRWLHAWPRHWPLQSDTCWQQPAQIPQLHYKHDLQAFNMTQTYLKTLYKGTYKHDIMVFINMIYRHLETQYTGTYRRDIQALNMTHRHLQTYKGAYKHNMQALNKLYLATYNL